MSLTDLTRISFLRGISPQKWVSLCKVMKNQNTATFIDFESDLSNSILILFQTSPGDPILKAYIIQAIHGGILSLHSFVASFLQAAKSPSLQLISNLDILCKLIMEEHYRTATGDPTLGSIINYAEPVSNMLAVIRDGFNLLRLAYAPAPPSPFHSLPDSATELVRTLVSCIGEREFSQISPSQATILFGDTHTILQIPGLRNDLHNSLEAFAFSLSIIIGDDTRMAQEELMLQNLHLAFVRGEILGPNSDSDIVTASLFLRQMVGSRAAMFGAGNTPLAAATIASLYRWTSWSPAVFYRQLLLSVVTCLAQTRPRSRSNRVWWSFVLTRLPHLLLVFEQIVRTDSKIDGDWRGAMQEALTALYRQGGLISRCYSPLMDSLMESALNEEISQGATAGKSIFLRSLAHYYTFSCRLLDETFVRNLDPALLSPVPSTVGVEAQEAGLDLEAYIESKLFGETYNHDEAFEFLHRALDDFVNHPVLSQSIQKRIASLVQTQDVEGLSHLCKLLYSNQTILEVMSLHIKLSNVVAQLLLFFEDCDIETIGDPQTAVVNLGDLILFLQSTLIRFQLTSTVFNYNGRKLSPYRILSTSVIYSKNELSVEEASAYSAWFKALFDSGSEGIDDSILRATKPKVLMKLSASLIMSAAKRFSGEGTDADIIHNGVSYFTGPLLNWTLVGVIKALIEEISRTDFKSLVLLEVLHTLVQSPTCPPPVRSLTAHDLLRLLSTPRAANLGQDHPMFDKDTLRKTACEALGIEDQDPSHASILSVLPESYWHSRPKQYIQDALGHANAGQAPHLDVALCILLTGPTSFLKILWEEMSSHAPVGNIENCRRIFTFALTCPPDVGNQIPPLLPIFLHRVLPGLLLDLDRHDSPVQAIKIELLVAIISSSLTATLQMEWALLSVESERRFPLGQPCAMTARRLAFDLKRSESSTAVTVLQRLSSSQSFIANFPVMAS